MYAKTLVFLLLGISLVLAVPVDNETKSNNEEEQESFFHQITELAHQVNDYFHKKYDNIKSSFGHYFQKAKEDSKEIVELSKEQIAEFKKEHEKIIEEAKNKITDYTKQIKDLTLRLKDDSEEAVFATIKKIDELKDLIIAEEELIQKNLESFKEKIVNVFKQAAKENSSEQ